MSDLVINVKQIASYPAVPTVQGSDTLLLQRSGLGGPYMSVNAAGFVGEALASSGPMGVGRGFPPADADIAQIFTGNIVLGQGPSGAVLFNAYVNASGFVPWSSGAFGLFNQSPLGFEWLVGSGQAGQPSALSGVMALSNAGALTLNNGTLTVARDPSYPMEVATMGWVGNNTVHSFNNRIGQVQLTASDVYQALGYTDYIATQPWVINAINGAIGNFITSYPLVTTFNGRTGDIWLTLSDITCTFFQPGQQPISPTPPATSNDNSIATTQWVTTFVTDEIAGSGGILATQQWVLANTVNSFNGRQGVVTLTASDVFNVGAAPLNSPNFSGIPAAPTANPGTSTAQIATTAFVQTAVQASTTGVSSFNTRTGAVTLTNADVTGAGGLSNPSANLTGTPTAPTATAGTNTTQLATTAFVAAALTNSVTSFNTRTGSVTLQLADVTGVGGAPLASPTFTGTPAGPTAAPLTSTTQLATTQFVTAAITAAGGVSSFNSRTGAVTLTNNDITAAGGLSNPSANLTGVPLAPTAAVGTNNTQIATTGFVQAALTAGAVTSFNTRTGAVVLSGTDITNAGGALLAGPAFTGNPTAPTQTAGTSNTTLATTAFVAAAISAGTAGVTSFNTRTGAVVLSAADITSAGGALLASPALSGTPTAPTATAGTSTTQLATTAFVMAAVGAGTVASFNGRTGTVTLTSNDLTAAGGALIASPTFTGTPAAPTAAPGTNTTQLATTAFAVAGDALRVLKAGDTMTGSLTVPDIYLRPDASGYRLITGQTAAGLNRWQMYLGDGSTESGSNAGSNFALQALADNGSTVVGNALAINRATLAATFVGNVSAALVSGNVNVGGCQLRNTDGGLALQGGSNHFNITGGGSLIIRPNGAGTNGGTMQMTAGGYMLFNIMSGATCIQINPDASCWCTGGTWNSLSDPRIKTGVAGYHYGLRAIEGLTPITFRYNGEGGSVLDSEDVVRVGLDAAATADVLPDAVKRTQGIIAGQETEVLGIDSGPVIWALVNAVKELAGGSAVLRERIEALEARAAAAAGRG